MVLELITRITINRELEQVNVRNNFPIWRLDIRGFKINHF